MPEGRYSPRIDTTRLRYRYAPVKREEDERTPDPVSTAAQVVAADPSVLQPQSGGALGLLGTPVGGAVTKVLDLLARPNYAVANAIEEGIVKRRGAQGLFEGAVAGITGRDKDTFSDVLKKAGVGRGPSVKVGPLDISARDVAGFGLDVALDPTTYLTFGGVSAARRAAQTAVKSVTRNTARELAEPAVEGALQLVGRQTAGFGPTELGQTVFNVPLSGRLRGKTPGKDDIRIGLLPFDPLSAVGYAAGKVTDLPGAKQVKEMVRDALGETFQRDYALKRAGFGVVAEGLQRLERSRRLTKSEAVELAVRKLAPLSPDQRELFFRAADTGFDMANAIPGRLANTGDEAVDTLLNWYRGEYEPTLRAIKDEMGLASHLENYIHRLFPEKLKMTKAAAGPTVIAQKGTLHVARPKLKESLPGSFLEREGAEGYSTDPVLALAFDRAETLIKRDTNNFIEQTLHQFGHKLGKDEKPVHGFTSYVHKEGERWAVPVEVGEALTIFINPKEQVKLWKLFDAVQGFWKGSVTSLFPAFHMRNASTNVFMNWQAGISDVTTYTDALKAQLAEGGVFKDQIRETLFATVPGLKKLGETGSQADKLAVTKTGKLVPAGSPESVPLPEFLRELRVNGAMDTGFYGLEIEELLSGARSFADMGALGKALEQTEGARRRTLKTINAFWHGRMAGKWIEDNARLAHVLGRMRLGDTVEEAIGSAKRYLFDYGDLSETERNVFRRVIPFYTWSRKALPRVTYDVLHAPGPSATLGKVVDLVGQDAGMTPDELALLPDYVQERWGVVVGKDQDGKPLVLHGVGLPIEELNKFWTLSPRRTADEWFGMISPLLKAPLEYMFDYSTFTGRHISDESYQNYYRSAYPIVKQVPGLADFLEMTESVVETKDGERTYYNVNPQKMYLFSTIIGRLYTTTGKAFDPRKDMATQALNTLTGLTLSTVDVQRAAVRELRGEWTGGMQRILDERNHQLQQAATGVLAKLGTWEENVMRENYRKRRGDVFSEAAIKIEALKAEDLAKQGALTPEKLAAIDRLLPPVDRELNRFHEITPDVFADPESGFIDWKAFYRARDGFLDGLEPALRTQVQQKRRAYIEKLPPEAARLEREYQHAIDAYRDYLKLPPFAGPAVSEEQLARMQFLNRVYMSLDSELDRTRWQNTLPAVDRTLLQRYFTLRTRRNPARQRFLQQHPELKQWGLVS